MRLSNNNSAQKTVNNLLLETSVSLADKNWLQTGGHARFFCQPETIVEFQQALHHAITHDIPLFVLGLGANILISDSGFNGLVVRPRLKEISITQSSNDTVLVTAGSGVTMQELISFCLSHNIIGLEEFSGIPGTVGGSVFINLHYYEFFLSHFLHQATIIEKKTGVVSTVNPDWFNFGYNDSRLLRCDFFLIDATFKLTQTTELQTAYARGRSVEIIRHRVKRYPYLRTCGSFFRNFLPSEVPQNGITAVAYYLDQVGARSLPAIGGVRVSHQHANMLITSPESTSADVIALARTMQQAVLDMFGIIPKPECQLIGFDEYPLLESL